MKKITFLITAFLFSVAAVAQDSPGNRPELLLNKTVMVKPLTDGVLAYEKGYDAFFTSQTMAARYAENKSRRTKHDALAKRYFKIQEIQPVNNPVSKDYLIQLRDTVTEETIYYKFNPQSESLGKYYFQVVGGLKYPADFFCDFIEEHNDKAKGENVFKGSIVEGLHIKKIKKGKEVTYRLDVVTVEQVISMLRGVTLVFENGQKIEKPDAEAQMSTNKNDNIVYIASVELTPAELSLLQQQKVVSGKISKFAKTYTEGEKLKGMARCIAKK